MTEQGKKVWKELEKMGWSNEPEDMHLEYFEDIIEATKKVLTIPVVAIQSEHLICKGKCEHGYKDDKGNELFCSIKLKTR